MVNGSSSAHRGRVDRRTVLQTVAGVGLGTTAAVGGGSAGPDATAGGDLVWAFEEPGDFVFSSPTVADRTVFVASGDGNDSAILYAVGAAMGEKEWEHQLQASGFAESSPTVVNGTVYVGSGGFDISGTLHAVDAATGDEAWTFTAPNWILSSPTVAGGTVYVGSDDGTLYAVDAGTGTQEWAFTAPPAGVRSSPTVFGGTVYVATDGTDDNNGDDATLYAVDAETGTQEWAFEGPSHDVKSSPTVSGGTVYVGSGNVLGEGEDSTLYAVDAETGTQEWAFTTPGEFLRSSPTVSGGTVYIGSDDETLYAVDAESGTQEWAFENPSGWLYSSPTVADGTVYVGSEDTTLYAVDAETGDEEWTFEDPTDWVNSSPTVEDGIVYVGSEDTTLYAVDAGVEGSSEGSRVQLGTLGHTEAWDGTDPAGSVSGTVTDGNGDTVEGATATLLDGETAVVETETDPSGTYALTAAAGPYTLAVQREGFDPFSEAVTVQRGQETQRDVTLTPSQGTVLGTVTDTGADPVEDATVALVEQGETVAEADTDASGGYSLSVAPGSYDLLASQAGFAPFEQAVSVEAGTELTVDATLGPPSLPGFDAPPQDMDGDGRYENVDGDDQFDIFDVQTLFASLDSDAVQDHPAAFNFNDDEGPEQVTIFDVQGLFGLLQQQ
jgi:outer membrane protein assembly factor BamB